MANTDPKATLSADSMVAATNRDKTIADGRGRLAIVESGRKW
jgi:hypothetical protein